MTPRRILNTAPHSPLPWSIGTGETPFTIFDANGKPVFRYRGGQMGVDQLAAARGDMEMVIKKVNRGH